jgi:hypothetical protein
MKRSHDEHTFSWYEYIYRSRYDGTCRNGCELRETVHSFLDADDVCNNNTLIHQLYWRGIEFNFLEYLPYHLSSKQCAKALESHGILMNRNTSPEEAVEWILREENLIPRLSSQCQSRQKQPFIRIEQQQRQH